MRGAREAMKRIIALFVLAVFAAQVSMAVQSEGMKKISDLTRELRAAKDLNEKVKFRDELSRKKPASAEEVEELLKLVDDEDEFVKKGATKAFRDVKDPLLAPVFRKRIKKGKLTERAISIELLGKMKDKESVPDLIDMVKEFDGKDIEKGTIGLSSAYALGEIGDERGIPVLLSKLGKMNAQEAQIIAKFGKKALPQLVEIIKTSKNKEEQREAGNAIGMMKDPDAVPGRSRRRSCLRRDRDAFRA